MTTTMATTMATMMATMMATTMTADIRNQPNTTLNHKPLSPALARLVSLSREAEG